jgi:uncharacterized protein YuzE
MKTTAYFRTLHARPDRAVIQEEWILRTITQPEAEQIQSDERIRRWRRIPEMDNRALRVILLADGETVHTHSSTAVMKAKYFEDTDTLYLELRDSRVVNTRDLDEDTLLDYDADGRVVGITIEHAKSRLGGPRIEMETVAS